MSLCYQRSPSHDDAHASAQVKLLVVFDAHKVDDVCNDSVILRYLKAGSKARVVAVTDQVEQCVNGFNKVRSATLQPRHFRHARFEFSFVASLELSDNAPNNASN